MASVLEESWTDWLCDMEPEDYSFINQSEIKADDGSLPSQHDIAAAPQQENPQRSFSTESHCSYATFNTENTSTLSNSSVAESSLEMPSKLLKTEHLSQKTASSPCSYILSFDKANPPPIKVEPPALKPKTKVVNHGIMPLSSKNNELKRVIQGGKKISSFARSTHHTPDHIIAERMRREKISQQFIALSALIPDLKKMDKASVLGDAIKYVKQLKEQVKQLEEQSKRKSVESVVFVKKSQLSADEDVSDTSSNSCNGNSDDPSKINLSLPEVEARVSEKKVLIRILCEKEKAVLGNIFKEIEKLHLSVINSSSFCFGSSVMVITTIAEMEDEFNMSVKKLATNLRVGLMQFM